ncbi:hypothetical protein [Crossiella cryophila]|uniref:Heparin binding hemagglutinin HbhA n=1 Tax=Crossiella cryophila TaxID=43355 RepID=A0A7W7C4W1_9PSEU|nr:hypothetical protein [Crossiella cryophila]MBB4674534.1 heparin binding hemagglutinin HbhA [Crossiella cryophila]
MPALPTAEDVRKATEQAAIVFNTAIEQARTPLLAALGAGDLAAKAVVDALTKARETVGERAEKATTAVNDLPAELGELRNKLDPAEFRKIVDAYTQAAQQLYGYLAERGEATLDKLRSNPQVQTAQHRVEEAAAEVRELADDVLGKVTRRTRVAGEKTAAAAEKAAEKIEDVAVKVEEAGANVAAATKTATRKPAAKPTTGARKTTGPSTTGARKTTS